ncbi:MAG: Flp pilus assembly complex ATPase component TadA [Nitrospirae bacterium]|nr:Flp pilus assembly complex ATPase component TadA [Nitrospirota bacterium]
MPPTTTRRPSRQLLSDIIVDMGLVSRRDLDHALEESRKQNVRVGEILLRKGLVSEEQIAQALARQFTMTYVRLEGKDIASETVKLIPEAVARRHTIVPVESGPQDLMLGMADPLNIFALDQVKMITRHKVQPVVCSKAEILRVLDRVYAAEQSVKSVLDEIDLAGLELLAQESESPATLEKVASDTSIVKLVNTILYVAVQQRASDIHLEPQSEAFLVRMRIDGVLYKLYQLPLKVHMGVVSRIKIMGGMDIAEKRVPQDGRFEAKIGDHQIDVRVSSIPLLHGEKAELRILEKSRRRIQLEDLPMEGDTRAQVEKAIQNPYGLFVVSGPTGSGKTTTLYAVLNCMNAAEKNIVTVEDPVEYQLPNVNQIPINPRANLTFATALRSILRQDPDVIMVGEIRDRETAEISIQAALTGHLVLTTLHTNSAPGAVSRLVEMGVEPYLISSSLLGVLGQRLVRQVCPDCKQPHAPEPAVLANFEWMPENASHFFRGAGCSNCRGTGYRGRLAVFELMRMGPAVRKSILHREDLEQIAAAAQTEGFRSLRQNGLELVVAGRTTLEEIVRVTRDVEI